MFLRVPTVGKDIVYKSAQEVMFVLMLNIPVNNFSDMSGRSHRFLGITSTFQGVNVFAQGHNTAEVGIGPPHPLASESETLPLGNRAPLAQEVIAFITYELHHEETGLQAF